jgi:hypothetical protein
VACREFQRFSEEHYESVFTAPASGEAAPEYLAGVEHPMDLGAMQARLEGGVYPADLGGMRVSQSLPICQGCSAVAVCRHGLECCAGMPPYLLHCRYRCLDVLKCNVLTLVMY